MTLHELQELAVQHAPSIAEMARTLEVGEEEIGMLAERACKEVASGDVQAAVTAMLDLMRIGTWIGHFSALTVPQKGLPPC